MKTDDLISVLAADSRPAAPLGRGLAVAALGSAVAVAGVVVLGMDLRPDLGAALATPVVALKTVLPLLLLALALPLVLRLGRPGLTSRPLPAYLWIVPAIAAAAVALTLARAAPAAWPALITGQTLGYCLVSIPALSVIPLAALLLALRRGAPTDPSRAGLAAGLAAGAIATALYSLHCPEDSPLFYGLWYGAGIAVAGLAGRFLGPRLLRW